MLTRSKPTRFYCFSPPIMLATFAIEIGLLVYVALKSRPTILRGVVIALLFLLAMFQLSEYNICGRLHLDGPTWTRIGYVSITLLPALGIHVIDRITGKLNPWWRRMAYLTSAVWASMFAFANMFDGLTCGGNYVIFQMKTPYGGAYYWYYYFWLIAGILLAFYYGVYQKATKGVRRAMIGFILGYLLFLVPTTLMNSLYPRSEFGLPSIMCGFAILYALILVFVILPAAESNKGKLKARVGHKKTHRR